MNRRKRMIGLLIFSASFLIIITLCGYMWQDEALLTDFSRKNLPPGIGHLFGTDWMGRDMFIRTISGLSMSIRIGLLTATASAIIAVVLGCLAAAGRAADSIILWLIDLVMGIPHILLLMLISFACGKGFFGVVLGVSLTHWTSLSRLLRSEVLQIKQSNYVRIAEKLGISKTRIAIKHFIPHLLPQFFVGLILLFPHAILHEASITFLGFGLSPEQPAVGIILSEGIRYLATGEWWLTVFPGAMLVFTVILFDRIGSCTRMLLDPAFAHE